MLTDEEMEEVKKTIRGAICRGGVPLFDVIQGKEVLCVACQKGHYRPSNPAVRINHYFSCDNCGDIVHWDTVIDID